MNKYPCERVEYTKNEQKRKKGIADTLEPKNAKMAMIEAYKRQFGIKVFCL